RLLCSTTPKRHPSQRPFIPSTIPTPMLCSAPTALTNTHHSCTASSTHSANDSAQLSGQPRRRTAPACRPRSTPSTSTPPESATPKPCVKSTPSTPTTPCGSTTPATSPTSTAPSPCLPSPPKRCSRPSTPRSTPTTSLRSPPSWSGG